eukprot:TRINITY_DN32120_c0_g1_i2.p3 TRINITY_DN32120_c0_g1~~TRINITY_DN32120_c0_g1_i2.p3  ORF type:complete len:134 (-),score=45.19 TRINITY_DN32120_c0_g1_i2:4-405(-)
MQRGLVGSEMCIRDRYQRRVHGAKLLNLYSLANNLHATLFCIMEILESFSEDLNVRSVPVLPHWIEEPFYRLIAKNGLRLVAKYMEGQKLLSNQVLAKALERARALRVYGHDKQSSRKKKKKKKKKKKQPPSL